MKPNKLVIIIVLVLFMAVVFGVVGMRYMQPSGSKPIDKTLDSDHDGIPDYLERTLGTNPYSNDTDGDGKNDSADQHPNRVDFKVNATTGPAGFKLGQVLVENNVDPVTKKAVSDHLEIALKNTIGKDINNISVFYTVTDTKTGQNESYLVKLTGFVLTANTNTTIHFDKAVKANHFGYNPNGLYYRSKNKLEFNILVNAPGYSGQIMAVTKDAGGAETPD